MPLPACSASAAARLRRALSLLGLFAAPFVLGAAPALPAFPGAEGFGAYAAGGRGGDVYTVTNLAGEGPGSLAEGLATVPDAGRTIVFAVSGYIPLPGKNLRLTKGRVTIAGQTAPGDGVGLRGGTFRISAPDVIVRHLRLRHGRGGAGGDCLNLDEASTRSIIDHVAMQFSTDENMSSFKRPPDFLTLQYSLNAWGLETHSCGGLWDQNHATSLYNLWAHNHTRNPKARPIGLLEWVNNVTFDWDIGFILGDSETPMDWKANILGNYFVCPPGNIRKVALEKARVASDGKPNFTLHIADNFLDNDGDDRLDGDDAGWDLASGSYTRAEKRLRAEGGSEVVPVSPCLAYKKIVSDAGPLRLDALSGRPLRDEVDTILIGNLVNLRRGHVRHEKETGAAGEGFGILESTPAPLDTDQDGMPDAYENALGWNPASPDHNTPLLAERDRVAPGTYLPADAPAGYTRLEEYLHFLASPHATLDRDAPDAPASITVDLSRYTEGFNAHAPKFAIALVAGGRAVQSGEGGRLVTFTPAAKSGRARFEFKVTDAQGDSWARSFLILVSGAPASASAKPTASAGHAGK